MRTSKTASPFPTLTADQLNGAARTFPYRVRPFSGGDAGHEGFRKNEDRAYRKSADAWPCVICGRAIEMSADPIMVEVTADMGDWAPVGVKLEGSRSGGSFPVGPDCHRKYRVKA